MMILARFRSWQGQKVELGMMKIKAEENLGMGRMQLLAKNDGLGKSQHEEDHAKREILASPTSPCGLPTAAGASQEPKAIPGETHQMLNRTTPQCLEGHVIDWQAQSLETLAWTSGHFNLAMTCRHLQV